MQRTIARETGRRSPMHARSFPAATSRRVITVVCSNQPGGTTSGRHRRGVTHAWQRRPPLLRALGPRWIRARCARRRATCLVLTPRGRGAIRDASWSHDRPLPPAPIDTRRRSGPPARESPRRRGARELAQGAGSMVCRAPNRARSPCERSEPMADPVRPSVLVSGLRRSLTRSCGDCDNRPRRGGLQGARDGDCATGAGEATAGGAGLHGRPAYATGSDSPPHSGHLHPSPGAACDHDRVVAQPHRTHE
jgi:hypothetical protein